jgi:hypothetical protein
VRNLPAWRLLANGVTPPGSAEVSSFIFWPHSCTHMRWLPLQS